MFNRKWTRVLAISTVLMILSGCGKAGADVNVTSEQESSKAGSESADIKTGDENETGDESKTGADIQTGDENKTGEDDQTGEDRKEEQPIEIGALAKGVNGMTYKMLNQMDNKQNYFISPYSICSALAVVDNAANGETKKQIEDTLGIENLDDYNKQINSFSKKDRTDKIELTSANALWLSEQYPFNESAKTDYIPRIQEYYGAEVNQADFANNKEQVVNDINSWVSEHTGGMIKGLKSKETVSDQTIIDLINAVYFNGEWTNPFFEEDTHKKVFHGTKEDKEIDMMNQSDVDYGYYEADGLRSITLPYGDGSIVMNVIISEDPNTVPGDIFAQLSDEEKEQFLSNALSAEEQNVLLALPKFNMQYQIDDLKSNLMDLGIEDLFNEGKADLKQLGDGIYVTNACHIAKIEVDEKGSRASAITEFMTDGVCMSSEDTVRFLVDHPFLYIIRDKDSGMILFIGQMLDME